MSAPADLSTPVPGQADLPGFEQVLVAGAVLKGDRPDQTNLFESEAE